jgi:hypothetical protein
LTPCLLRLEVAYRGYRSPETPLSEEQVPEDGWRQHDKPEQQQQCEF